MPKVWAVSLTQPLTHTDSPHWQNSLPYWFNLLHLLPSPPVPILLKLKYTSITCCQICHYFTQQCCGCIWISSILFQLPGCILPAGRNAAWELVSAVATPPPSSPPPPPLAFMDYWWNSLVQFGCLIDKARMKKKKEKNINTKISTLCIQCLFFLA